jgi:glycopeptide antibiotics resistance protein
VLCKRQREPKGRPRLYDEAILRFSHGPAARIPLLNDRLQGLRGTRRLELLCGLAILAVLIATLWPFDFFLRNRVAWLPGTNGIQFGRAGVVVSEAPLRGSATGSGDSCSLEILLRPARVDSVHTILSFYIPNTPGSIRVRQYKDGLLVSREFVDAEKRTRTPKFDVDHFFGLGQLVLLTITSGPKGTVVYKDGRRAQTFSRFTISPASLSGSMVMGTSGERFEPWQGEVRGLSIYSRELTPAEALQGYADWTNGSGAGTADPHGAIARYAFTEGAGREIHNSVTSGPNLEIPTMFAVPFKPFLNSPVKDFEANWDYVLHFVENIAGFLPLGLLGCVYFGGTRSRGRAILYTIVAAAFLSLTIESLQAYIPQRESDVTDIISNTLGASLGALLAQAKMLRPLLERTKLIAAQKNSAPQS